MLQCFDNTFIFFLFSFTILFCTIFFLTVIFIIFFRIIIFWLFIFTDNFKIIVSFFNTNSHTFHSSFIIIIILFLLTITRCLHNNIQICHSFHISFEIWIQVFETFTITICINHSRVRNWVII